VAAKGVVDALTNTYTDIAKMKLLPDANQHMQFLHGLEQGIMQYIQMAAQATLTSVGGGAAGIGGMGGGIGAGGEGVPGMEGAPGMGAGGPEPGAGMGAGGGAPGPMTIAPGGGAGMSGLMGGAGGGPNPDDLRRLLAQGPPG
jgi:hypothetical protein